MTAEKNDNIIIAFYKNFSRTRVLNVSLRTLRLIIIVNSVLIVLGIVFSLSFLYQWAKNDQLRRNYQLIKKENLVIKKETEAKNNCQTQASITIPRPMPVDSEEREEQTTENSNSPIKIDEVKMSVEKPSNELIITFTIQNINQGGDLISGYIVTLATANNFIASYPDSISFKDTKHFVNFDRGEKFSVRVYRKSVSKLPLPPANKQYDKINIFVYSLNGELLESREYNVNEYIKY